jgi:carboxylesterase type B
MKFSTALLFATALAAPKCQKIQIGDALIQGLEEESTTSYLAIPFAKAPIGDLRLKAPQEIKLTGNIQAKAYGPGCIQAGYTGPETPFFSEDCLQLNVIVPTGSPKGLPVIVYVYGGSFNSGSAYSQGDARRFVKANPDVVFVTINYRLGAFGFLSGKELETDSSLNLGLLDQKAAFEWVRKNIAKFGGDPTKITAMGESAGALSLAAHLLAQDGSQKMFDRAIQLSGGTGFGYSVPSDGQGQFDKLSASTGCSTATDVLSCLRTLDAPTFYNATKNFDAGIVQDGTYITKQPLVSLKDGTFSKVPQIFMNDRDEGSVFVGQALLVLGLTPEAATGYMRNQVSWMSDEDFKTILALYPFNAYKQNFFDAASDLWGDVVFQCGTKLMGEKYVQAGVEVYSWINNFVSSFKYEAPVSIGVFHSSELAFIFNQMELPSVLSDVEVELGQKYRNAIVDFAQGKAPLAPNWNEYTLATRYDISAGQNIPDTSRTEKCNFLLGKAEKIFV